MADYQARGKITDKILTVFNRGDKALTYRRPSREDSRPMPKDGSVKGIKLSGRKKK